MAKKKVNILAQQLAQFADEMNGEEEIKPEETKTETSNEVIETKQDIPKEEVKKETAATVEVIPGSVVPKDKPENQPEKVEQQKPVTQKKTQKKKEQEQEPEQEEEVDDESLEATVKKYIKKIEQAKQSEKKVNLSFVPGEKLKFEDKYPIFSSPARREIHEIIDILCKNSNMKKYEIFELLIYGGLKNIFKMGEE